MTKSSTRYSTKEAAKRIGVSKDTLLRWLYEKKVAEPPRDRRGWRVWTDEDVARVIEWNDRIVPARVRPQPEPQGAR